MESIKPIPATYSANGYDYKLLERKGDVAIYEQWHRGNEEVPRRLVAYEVVKVRASAGREIHGRVIEASERLPSTNEWGRYGWTFGTGGDMSAALERARVRVLTLLKPQKAATVYGAHKAAHA